MRGFAFAVLALTACSGDAGMLEGDFALRVRTPTAATEVPFGEAFPLQVDMVWRRDLVPEPIRDEAFAPLRVRLRDTTQREVDGRIAETRRYDAFAFARGELTVPAIVWKARPRAGGDERTATNEAFTLQVKSALADQTAVAAELPGDLLLPTTPAARRWPWLLLVLAPLVAWLAWRRRARPAKVAPPPVTAPTEPAHARALARVAALREQPPQTNAEVKAWCTEAVQLARDYVLVRFAVAAAEMTTDELLAAAPLTHTLPDAPRTHLTRLCQIGDLVKFARFHPEPDTQRALLADAEAFVRGTAQEELAP